MAELLHRRHAEAGGLEAHAGADYRKRAASPPGGRAAQRLEVPLRRTVSRADFRARPVLVRRRPDSHSPTEPGGAS
jgi:hypothetical protein